MKRLPSILLCFSLFACGGLEGPPGPTGPQGQTGSQGPAGPRGPEGEDGAGLVSFYACDAAMVIGTSTRHFDARRYDFADGSVMTSCAIVDNHRETTATRMYKGGQNGAINGSCLLTYDVDTSSSGWWEFSVSKSGSGSARYSDGGSASSGTTVTLACTKY